MPSIPCVKGTGCVKSTGGTCLPDESSVRKRGIQVGLEYPLFLRRAIKACDKGVEKRAAVSYPYTDVEVSGKEGRSS